MNLFAWLRNLVVKTTPVETSSAAEYPLGIDVSHWQGICNWDLLKSEGIKFAFAKASELVEDDKFAENWAGIKRVGMPRSGYHFLRPKEDVVKQAKLFVSLVSLNGKYTGDLPPVADVEINEGLQPLDLEPKVRRFIYEVELALKIPMMIYTSVGAWDSFMPRVSWAKDRLLMVANYRTGSPLLPNDWTRYGKSWTFWQFTEDLDKRGVQSAGLDGDYYNGTWEQFKRQFNWGRNFSIFLPNVRR